MKTPPATITTMAIRAMSVLPTGPSRKRTIQAFFGTFTVRSVLRRGLPFSPALICLQDSGMGGSPLRRGVKMQIDLVQTEVPADRVFDFHAGLAAGMADAHVAVCHGQGELAGLFGELHAE